MRCLVLFALIACNSNAEPTRSTVKPAIDPGPTTGRVVTETFFSPALGVDRAVRVYLPAGYDPAGTRRYPVMYYLHGLGGNEGNWLEGGKLDHAADALHLQAIVVMPDGDNGFYIDSDKPVDYEACMRDGTGLFDPLAPKRQTCAKTSKYETYITKDLVAWTDGTYKTIAAREGRAIAGLSMGGYGALMLAMRHPELFAAAASHSGVDALLYTGPFPYEAGKVTLIEDPKTWGTMLGQLGDWIRELYGPDIENWRARDPATLAGKLAPGKLALYLDCGTEDGFLLHNGMRYLHDILTSRKIEHAYYIGPGRHDFNFWRERLPKSLAYLRDALARPR